MYREREIHTYVRAYVPHVAIGHSRGLRVSRRALLWRGAVLSYGQSPD